MADNSIEGIDDDILFLSSNPNNIKFSELFSICKKYFPDYRNSGSSHFIFKTPWPGDPRINIQRDKTKKMAKPYQVKQVKAALERLRELKRE